MSKLFCWFLFALAVCSNNLSAQVTRHHGVFWGRLVLAGQLTEKWKTELFLQKRTQNVPGKTNIFQAPHFTSIWLWFSRPLAKNINLSVSPIGYFNSYTFLADPSDVDIPGVKEFRWTVRLEHEQKWTFLSLANRYTVEYRRRDIDHNDKFQPNWRIRYQVRAGKNLLGILPNKKPVGVFVSDEVLIQFGKAVRNNPNVFDQNRISAGFSFDVARNVRTSLSYLNIMQQRSNGKDFDDAHALWVVLTIDNLFGSRKNRPN